LDDYIPIALFAHITVDADEISMREETFPKRDTCTFSITDLNDGERFRMVQLGQYEGVEAVVAMVCALIGTTGIGQFCEVGTANHG
jgi:hypothetical protein